MYDKIIKHLTNKELIEEFKKCNKLPWFSDPKNKAFFYYEAVLDELKNRKIKLTKLK